MRNKRESLSGSQGDSQYDYGCVGEHKHKGYQMHIAVQEAGRGICRGEIYAIGVQVVIDDVVDPIYQIADKQAKEGTAKYVTRIVNAEINAGVRGDEGPEK